MKLTNFFLLMAWALWWVPFTHAQIAVSSQDILGTLGKTQTFEELTSGTLTIDIGNTGGPQLWNFAGLVFPARQSVEQYLAPQNTPYQSRFPGANFAYKFTSDLTGAGVVYAYLEITNADVKFLGGASVVSGIETFSQVRTYIDSPSLPMTFGRKWKSALVTTVQAFGLTSIDSAVTESTIDAWGTARLTFGDVECLRTFHAQTDYQTTWQNGQLLRRDTTRTTSYSWISKNYLEVADIATVRSQPNSRTVIAGAFSRLISSQTAVREKAVRAPAQFVLAQNFPNPFNPSTKIAFALPTSQKVTLKVFDLAGKEVATLLQNEKKAAGRHEVFFEAKTLPSGVYLYRLQAGDFMEAKRMVLLR